MAPHSSTLAWKIPWTEEPGRLQSMGSLRVGHDWETSLSRIGEGNGNPLQCCCLENPRDGGAWWAAIYGVAQSQTRLEQLSSSNSSCEPTIFGSAIFFLNRIFYYDWSPSLCLFLTFSSLVLLRNNYDSEVVWGPSHPYLYTFIAIIAVHKQ